MNETIKLNEKPIEFKGEHLTFYMSRYVYDKRPAIFCDSAESGPYAHVTVCLDNDVRISNGLYTDDKIAFDEIATFIGDEFIDICKELFLEGETWPIKYGYAESLGGTLKEDVMKRLQQEFPIH